MCHTVTLGHTLCKHKYKNTGRCEKYYDTGYQNYKKGARPKGFWRCLLHSYPHRHKHTSAKGFLQGYCDMCKTENEVFATMRRTELQNIIIEKREKLDALKQVEMQNLLNRQSSQRTSYTCNSCLAEGRIPTTEGRCYNSGLCCARGVDEFEERFQVRRVGKLNTRSKVSEADREKAMIRSMAAMQMASQQQMQHDTLSDSQRNGWEFGDRDSPELDPELVRGFLRISGTTACSLPPPPQVQHSQCQIPGRSSLGAPARTPSPVHDNRTSRLSGCGDPTGINWSQWDSNTQTAHGRFPPPPTAPPEKPLPQTPPRDSRIINRGRPQLRVHTPTYERIGYRPRESVSPVSPLDQSSFDFPHHELQRLASNLDAPLNEAYEAWSSVSESVTRQSQPPRR